MQKYFNWLSVMVFSLLFLGNATVLAADEALGTILVGEDGKTHELKKIVRTTTGGTTDGLTRVQKAANGKLITPEESLELVKKMNEGAQAKTLYYTNRNDKKVFSGYASGRLAMAVLQTSTKARQVYRGDRHQRQSDDGDETNVNKDNSYIKIPSSNRYASMRRKMSEAGKTMKPLLNRKQSSAEIIQSIKRRDAQTANKEYKFARSNGFHYPESRIAKSVREQQENRLKVIKTDDGVTLTLGQVKEEEPLETTATESTPKN